MDKLGVWCQMCPLWAQKGPVPAEIKGTGRCLFIGLYPGETEIEKGIPFAGRSGQYVRRFISGENITDYTLTNAVKCLPPSEQAFKDALVYCQHYLETELNRAKIVVLLGKELPTLLKTLLARFSGKILVTYNPAAIARGTVTYQQWKAPLTPLQGVYALREPPQVTFQTAKPSDVPALRAKINGSRWVVVDFEVDGKHPCDPANTLLSAALCFPDLTVWVLPLRDGLDPFIPVLEALHHTHVVAHNIMFEAIWLYRVTGKWVARNKFSDTLLIQYALREDMQGKYGLKNLVNKYFGVADWAEPIRSYIVSHQLRACPPFLLYRYNAQDAYWNARLYLYLTKQLQTRARATRLLSDILYRAAMLFARATNYGIKIDTDRLDEVEQILTQNAAELLKQLRAAAPLFNPNSPQQLAEILYRRFNMPVLDTTPQGHPSTKEEVLLKLQQWAEANGDTKAVWFLDTLLQYRETHKLLSAYVQGLREWVCSDGRVRPLWKLHGTVTGRVSCEHPNLQQIPAHSETANLIRSVFVPDDGCVFVEADFSNHELRVAAALAKDDVAKDIFVSGRDIHREVAAAIFNKPVNEVTTDERQLAKRINFGLLYGMSVTTLAEELSITVEQAERFVAAYRAMFPKVWSWRENILNYARQHGFVTTPTHRIRHLPEINHPKTSVKMRAERLAINTPVQGYASDLCLLTVINLTNLAINNGLPLTVLATIHDSVLFQTVAGAERKALELLDQAIKLVEREQNLYIPLAVEAAVLPHAWQKIPKCSLETLLAGSE